ncbi:MAG: hypothetical protein KBT28_08620 [Bacteroidales bacterium]|nr:hypothetical protein [Candidatus Colimorpha merdihippi]
MAFIIHATEGTTINNYDIHDNQTVNVGIRGKVIQTTEAPAEQGKPPLPEALTTPQAMKYWAALQALGFIDDQLERVKMSRKEAMYIADLFADKVGIEHKWATFERIFGMKHLAQEKNQMTDTGILPKRHREIAQVFQEK